MGGVGGGGGGGCNEHLIQSYKKQDINIRSSSQANFICLYNLRMLPL